MLARVLANQRGEVFLLCPNGLALLVNQTLLRQLLTDFKNIENFTGQAVGRWDLDGHTHKIYIDKMRQQAMQSFPEKTLAFISEQKTLTVIEPALFKGLLNLKAPNEYLTTREYADKYGVSPSRIKKLCQDNRIPGIMRKNGRWYIPASATYPKDARRNNT